MTHSVAISIVVAFCLAAPEALAAAGLGDGPGDGHRRRFVELIGDPDPRKVNAVREAMLQMVKLDVAALENAYRGA